VGFGEEKNLIFCIWVRTVDRTACSLVAMPTTLVRSCLQHHFGAIILHNSGFLYCCTVHFGNNLLHTNECTVVF